MDRLLVKTFLTGQEARAAYYEFKSLNYQIVAIEKLPIIKPSTHHFIYNSKGKIQRFAKAFLQEAESIQGFAKHQKLFVVYAIKKISLSELGLEAIKVYKPEI